MEFHISGSVSGDAGLLSVVGRCGDEPIRPGAVFRAILREKPRRYPDGLETPREVEACKAVRIRVSGVEAYGRALDELPANTTGVLRCDDSSVDLVPGGWILTSQCVAADA